MVSQYEIEYRSQRRTNPKDLEYMKVNAVQSFVCRLNKVLLQGIYLRI